ncbi:MAG: porphobilinogen synthase [Halobacteriaceae archaeon]
MELHKRPRRLRQDGIRELISETTISPTDLIAPVFVDATIRSRQPIESMPGHERVPLDQVVDRVTEIQQTGVQAIILFGVPEEKDQRGTQAWASDGVIQRAVRKLTSETDVYIITDVCLCEYTSHGHCGVIESTAESNPTLTVKNDETLELLAKIAISHAEAGADMVAPSGMIDGMVAAIRDGLDEEGFTHIPILSYAVKYHSSFYGPFRDAADGAPQFGDRRHYQMDPANVREGKREVQLDIDQGADILMVKPALPYLDVITRIRDATEYPIAAYNVSGEYAMLQAAGDRGWLDLQQTAYESIISIKRSGADLIITYFAEMLAPKL